MPAPHPQPDLDTRRRRLRFRAWHRGTREMDLCMGRFADSELETLPEAEIEELEALMEAPDRDVFSWLTGEITVPGNFDTRVFRRLRSFHTHSGPLYLARETDAATKVGAAGPDERR